MHEKDAEQLRKLAEVIRRDFEKDLTENSFSQATNVRGKSVRFNSKKALDDDYNTYWSTDDNYTTASLVIDFGKPTTFNRFLVQEYIPLGQRVQRFSIEAYKEDRWVPITGQTTIGFKRILRFDDVTSTKVKFNVLASKVCPAISNIEIYRAPKLLEPPTIHRDKYGSVTIEGFDTGLQIKFSTDRSEPARIYTEPFELSGKGQIKAIAIDTVSGESSEITVRDFDIISLPWSVVGYEEDNSMKFIFDTFEQSVWRNTESINKNQEVIIDLGKIQILRGFTYTPPQTGSPDGTIAEYSFSVRENGEDWTEIATGEFSNIRNNPVQQTITFAKVAARYVRFKNLREINDKPVTAIAEFGVLTD